MMYPVLVQLLQKQLTVIVVTLVKFVEEYKNPQKVLVGVLIFDF